MSNYLKKYFTSYFCCYPGHNFSLALPFCFPYTKSVYMKIGYPWIFHFSMQSRLFLDENAIKIFVLVL